MSIASRLVRSASLLLALLSAVVLGNARESACEMHGLGALTTQSMAVAHHGADHSMPDSAPASHHHDGGQQCCCIGECSAAVTVASAPVMPTLLVAFVDAQPR